MSILSNLAVLVYPANIIDYGRVFLLYLALHGCDDWAYNSTSPVRPLLEQIGVEFTNGRCFAALYSFSYLLDCFDGPVARALNQCSKLGYYLDMVIDRISSVLALVMAAEVISAGDFALPEGVSPAVAVAIFYFCAVMVEVVSHAVVCYYAEVVGVHQKLLGFDYAVVRLYLESKVGLGFGCVAYEMVSIGILCGWPLVAALSFPGFVFRAVANLVRLYSCMTLGKDSAAGRKNK